MFTQIGIILLQPLFEEHFVQNCKYRLFNFITPLDLIQKYKLVHTFNTLFSQIESVNKIQIKLYLYVYHVNIYFNFVL